MAFSHNYMPRPEEPTTRKDYALRRAPHRDLPDATSAHGRAYEIYVRSSGNPVAGVMRQESRAGGYDWRVLGGSTGTQGVPHSTRSEAFDRVVRDLNRGSLLAMDPD